MKRAIFAIAVAMAMTGIAVGQSLAVKTANDINKDIFSSMFAPGVSMTGVQNTPGIYDENNNRCWGNSFVLRGSGEWFTAQLTVSMDYVNGLPDPDNGNAVSLGHWSMVIYREDQYVGTFFGDIAEGSITWRMHPKSGLPVSRNTTVLLRPNGTIDGAMMGPTKMPRIRMNADTRLDGNIAFTNAVLDIDL